MLKSLDKRDTVLLKGLAISAIVLHNFYHLISPIHQNEFTFDPTRFWMLLEVHDPVQAIEGIFAFYGHFGVEVFVFLSAYGLAKSHWDDRTPWLSFLWKRIAKLYPVFGLVVLPWLIAISVQTGPVQALKTEGAKVFWMLAGVSNLMPGYGLPPVGPWWFIPFIIQSYAIWPLLRGLTNRFGPRGLLAISVLSLILVYAANPFLVSHSISLKATPIGCMPVFCLGTAAARFPVHLSKPTILAAAAALFLGSIYRALWPLTYVSALILALASYMGMRPILRKSPVLERVGQYSLLIFLINGVIRLQFLQYATSPLLGLFFGFVSAVVSFVVAALIQEFLMPKEMASKFSPIPRAAIEPDQILLHN